VERLSANDLNTSQQKEKKKIQVADGSGVKLGDIPYGEFVLDIMSFQLPKPD
jgi:hypothetical protein